jgi:hypothetical protein
MAKKRSKGTLEKQLKVYSVAAVGALALAPSAEAAIQYSGIQDLPVNSSTSQEINFNGSGPQFKIGYDAFPSGPSVSIRDVGIHQATGSAQFIKGKAGHHSSDPLNLPSNYQIRSTLAHPASAEWGTSIFNPLNGIVFEGVEPIAPIGNFIDSTGYIGVRFKAQCGTAYGWIHYTGTINVEEFTSSGTIIDWAYDDSCQPIGAGQGQTPISVPTLNEWGMIIFTLLLGGLAANMLRKQGKEAS